MIIYHGSAERVERPSIEKCRPHNDYGAGFYCTHDRGLAMEWACNRPGRDGFCNEYELDESGLVVVDLDSNPDGALCWIATLMENRIFDMEWNVGNVKDRFIERYRTDLSGADVVCGYRADDSYFSIARAFANGIITDVQTAAALRLGELGRQVVLRSPRAFEAVRFIRAEPAHSVDWYPRWAQRDQAARMAFRELLNSENASGAGASGGKRIYELVEG